MPKEIVNIDEVDEILTRTREIRVKKYPNLVKVKFRTRRYLYTLKLTPEEYEKIRPRLMELGIEIKDLE